MTKVLVFDFARVLLFPKDPSYAGGLNDLHNKLKANYGYKVSDYFFLNEELVSYLRILKEKYKLIMYTSEAIQNEPEFKTIIDGIFEKIISAKEIGYTKTDPAGYVFIADMLGVTPGDLLFIDDNGPNVQAAADAGWVGLKYVSNLQLKGDFEQLGIN